jgi:hypothetical protein
MCVSRLVNGEWRDDPPEVIECVHVLHLEKSRRYTAGQGEADAEAK